MTTTERNHATLALLSPLACPLITGLCALITAGSRLYARTIGCVISEARADHASRRALAAHRASMLNPIHCPMTYDGIPPVLCDADVVINPALSRRLADLTPAVEASEVVYTSAACQPIVERAEWVATQGLQHFAVRVDPAPVKANSTTPEQFEAQVARRALVRRLRSEPIGRRELQGIAKAHKVRANDTNHNIRKAVITLLEAQGI